ncbi:phosphatase PAP2 family protein [Chitinophaga sp. Cy-1792]|uniref:phosphatase PAP2 family protein n=1 Tax=Chitinophaga sp. Cy-1792 TaxID=2608339 RepID=UPI001420EF7D|nr:phosphatase PAP2 family protein [Chitinophaga sp. Cy-1792]
MKTLLTLFRKNAYFFLPFFSWVILGGVLLCSIGQRELFLHINGVHASWADMVVTGMTYLGDGIMFSLVLLLMLVTKRFKLFFTGLASFLLAVLIVQVAKHYYCAPRPISYFGDQAGALVHTVKWVTVHSSNSFPSGHSAGAFAMFCFLSLVLPNKRWGIAFIALALIAGYSRIYLAQHFFADVYVGSIIGTLSSIAAYSFFQFRNTTSANELCAEAILNANAPA